MLTNEWIAIILTSFAVFLLLFVCLLMLTRSWSSRPDDEDDGEYNDGSSPGSPLTAPKDRSDLQKLLMAAGYYHRSALSDFRTIRSMLIVVPLLIAGALGLVVSQNYIGRVFIGGLIGALLGFSIPRLVLAIRARGRGRQMARGLPLAIDLLTMCLSAGQNLHAALGQVAKELKISHPVLAKELSIVQKQAELHSLEVALQQWSDRVQVPEVSNFASMLIQSERLGTDTSATLTELANDVRSTARQRAEAQANRTSFWMLFPSVFCFWLAAAIILIAPAYMEFFDYRQKQNQEANERTRKGIERANRRTIQTRVDPNAQ